MANFNDTVWRCSRCGSLKTEPGRTVVCAGCGGVFGEDVDPVCPHGYAPDVHCDGCERTGFPNH